MRAIDLGTPEKVGDKVRWRKMFKGRRWNSSVYPEDSRRNRSAAWNEFLEWQSTAVEQINATRTPEENELEKAIELVAHEGKYWQMIGQHELATQRKKMVALLRTLLEDADHEAVRTGISKLKIDDDFSSRVAVSVESTKGKKTEFSAERVAEDFLKTHRLRAQSDEITAGRFGKMRSGINRFLNFFGKKNSMTELNEDTVKRYYRYLIELKNAGSNSNTLADDLVLFRQFVDEVSDDTPEIPKPRNLRSRKYSIARTRSEPNPFTPAEFRLVFENASDRTKLYLLLMLNCSFYQGDLAEMKSSQIDWEEGRICRARSKKSKMANKNIGKHEPIKINYKLWPETFRLLKRFGQSDAEIALTNQDGGPLVHSFIGKDGNEKRKDCVRSAYNRVIRKLKNRKLLPESFKKSLKQLRKTGPDMLDQHAEKYSEFIDVMLDHSRVANRSYLKSGKAYKPFDEALEFVGKQFGF